MGGTSTPERVSEQLKVTITGLLFHPKPLAADLELERLGPVLSMLIPLTVVEAELPAMSVQVPLLD